MVKIVDMNKLKKSLVKVEGLSYGFTEPKIWLSSGCYALNWLMTKDFNKCLPLESKIHMFCGESGCLPETAKVRIRIK